MGHYKRSDRKGPRTRLTPQVKLWSGRFGNNYILRNDYADWKIKPGVDAFRQMIGNIRLKSVLEVGSNIGLNLLFINNLLKGNIRLYAVEPNPKAFNILSKQKMFGLEKAWNVDAYSLPIEDSSIDLAFTAGVPIHIAPKDLGRAVDEIDRVARTYAFVLSISLTHQQKSHTVGTMIYYSSVIMVHFISIGFQI